MATAGKTDAVPAVTFTIHGTPFAKQRPRFSRASGRAFTPGETVSFERHVGDAARGLFAAPLFGPVRLTVFATFAPPPSWSKKKREAHLHRPHTQKPDLDNLAKAISDGLNRIAFADDSQIAEMTCRKVWGVTPQTVVIVEGI